MCKIINIISSESYVRANTEFIKLTNLSIATYTELLFTILNAVSKKKTYDPTSGLFKVDRAYITERTGIPAEDQKQYDLTLYKLGVVVMIDPANKNKISLSAQRYLEIIADPTSVPENLVSKTAKMTYAEKQAAKVAGIQAGIVELFGESDERAQEAVRKLVEVYYSKGVVKHEQWKPIVQMLHACTSDPDGISELVDYVIATNYVSIPAAVDSFMKKHAPTATKLNSKQTTCTGTMSGVEF